MKNITINNKTYLKIDSLNAGGGSDAIWVVFNKKNYLKLIDHICNTQSLLNKISKNINLNNYNYNQKKQTLDKKFKDIIKKITKKEKLTSDEKHSFKILKELMQITTGTMNTLNIYSRFYKNQEYLKTVTNMKLCKHILKLEILKNGKT